MTPRVRMQSLSGDAPVSDVLSLTRRTGFSRFPVLGEGVDDVIGLVHIKHVVAVPTERRTTTRVRDVAVPAPLAPESLHLDDLLDLLRGRGLQMAVVVDEYGGTAGIVTLEDVVEELVGDIPDEHDQPGNRARRLDDGSWSLSALLRLDEVRGLTGVALAESPEPRCTVEPSG
jgi:CBS domain containing-hemolysin-like protein